MNETEMSGGTTEVNLRQMKRKHVEGTSREAQKEAEMEYIQYYESPLGKILMSCDGKALSGLWFVDQKYYAATLPEEYEEKSTAVSDLTKKWLDIYFQ